MVRGLAALYILASLAMGNGGQRHWLGRDGRRLDPEPTELAELNCNALSLWQLVLDSVKLTWGQLYTGRTDGWASDGVEASEAEGAKKTSAMDGTTAEDHVLQGLKEECEFSPSSLLALLITGGTVGRGIRLIRHEGGLETLGVDASFSGRTGGMAQGQRWQGEDANEKC